LDYKKHVEFFFLSLICGIASVGVMFVAKMSDNVLQMTVAIKEINVKMESLKSDNGRFEEDLRDHEKRIRHLEIKHLK